MNFAEYPSAARRLALGLLVLVAVILEFTDGLIITSVIAGNKKFKTVSFDSKFLKPLTFEKDLPTTEFRRHRTVRPPKFDIDVNIPIKLPLEDEYPQEEYKKPVTSDIFFQTGEINEPAGKKYPEKGYQSNSYSDEQYAASSTNQDVRVADAANTFMRDGLKGLLPVLAKSIKIKPQIEINHASQSNARSDIRDSSGIMSQPIQTYQPDIMRQSTQVEMQRDPLSPASSYSSNNYSPTQYQAKEYGPEFIPGGFINLQLSGPSGGPRMTYEDYDKEKWAQQLSQTYGAMPYPILNYHQLQNFYGGLGTFTNGLAEHRYVEAGLIDKLKSSLNHFTNKFHFG